MPTTKNAASGNLQTILRSQIKLSDYNPRNIDPYAFKRLVQSVRSDGLVAPPIINSNTDNTVVGGHQRIKAADEVYNYPKNDYELPAVIINVSEQREKELNIRLNSPTLQGFYNLDMLSDLIVDPEIDIESTSFDITSLEMLYASEGQDLPPELNLDVDLEEVVSIMGDSVNVMDDSEDEKKRKKEQERLQEIKDKKQQFADRADFQGQTQFYTIVVFPTDQAKAEFALALGHDPYTEYLDGMQLAKELGIEIDAENDLQIMEDQENEKT